MSSVLKTNCAVRRGSAPPGCAIRVKNGENTQAWFQINRVTVTGSPESQVKSKPRFKPPESVYEVSVVGRWNVRVFRGVKARVFEIKLKLKTWVYGLKLVYNLDIYIGTGTEILGRNPLGPWAAP